MAYSLIRATRDGTFASGTPFEICSLRQRLFGCNPVIGRPPRFARRDARC